MLGDTMTEIHSLDEAMAAAAAAGVTYAQQQFGIVLDYSVESIESIETLLAKHYEAIPRGFFAKVTNAGPSSQDIERVTMMFGGYIGEVIKRHAGGGAWHMESSLHPGDRVLTFRTTTGLELWPQIKALKRLENGAEDNVWHYFQTLLAQTNKK